MNPLLRLAGRALHEALFVTGIGWAMESVVCLVGLVVLRYGVFEPIGLRFDLLNVTPWLVTLPIPMAVLLASSGATAWTLLKLDAISIIERRQ